MTTDSPEAELIEQATKASGRSVRSLAAEAGISDTRWRHLARGWQIARGEKVSCRARPATLARMAFVLGLSAAQLEQVGRSDAVPELRRLNAPAGSGVGSVQIEVGGDVGRMVSLVAHFLGRSERDFVEMAVRQFVEKLR